MHSNKNRGKIIALVIMIHFLKIMDGKYSKDGKPTNIGYFDKNYDFEQVGEFELFTLY